ncbi:unnamed protein product [Adineta ricciae]|uniref:Uncharacterized protein n=1 Tax=Adineta ricciae TaxID=249248 RepID=A0A814IP63_ADIRI|nr:unnamed protein product [Adineta ricciae]
MNDSIKGERWDRTEFADEGSESTTKKYCNKNTTISMSSNGSDNYAALETALRDAIIFGNSGNSTAFDKCLDHAANILTNSFSYSTCSQVDSTAYETKT